MARIQSPKPAGFKTLARLALIVALLVLALTYLMLHHIPEGDYPFHEVEDLSDGEPQYCECQTKPEEGGIVPGGIPYEDTTCHPLAHQRGSGQKVVSFSLYGDSDEVRRKFFEGISKNLMMIKKAIGQ